MRRHAKGLQGSRSGQITVVVIVGLMLVLVFGLVFSLRNSLPGVREAVTPNKVLSEIESGLVKDHVTSCVYKLASDGLERIGANGGLIYDFEGGKIPLNTLLEGRDFLNYTVGGRRFLVAYGLRENRFCPVLEYSAPDYPVPDVYLSDLSRIYSQEDACMYNHSAADYDGAFGQNALPKLCSFLGENSCKPFAKGPVIGFTIEKQLEDYIANKLHLCVNVSEFGEQFDADLEAGGEAVPEVSVRDDDIQVVVAYPFRITFKDQAPITKVVEYQTVIKARLGSIYNFAYEAISRDAREPGFNLSSQAFATSSYRQGFEFRRIKDACKSCPLPYMYDDIFEVIDTSSIPSGKPLLFRFAVQNRMPALDVINNSEYELSILAVPQVSDAVFPISAFDPDDVSVKLVFLSEGYKFGWRESENVFFESDAGMLFVLPLSSISDYGIRPVAVLAIDDSGLFDFQNFQIQVNDSDMIFSASDLCLGECQGTGWDCQKWCWISANPCQSECQAGYSESNPSCMDCVGNIYYAEDLETHADCPGVARKEDCIALVPDCFWVLEDYGDGEFLGSCYNDWDLKQASHPAFIALD